MGQTQEVFEDDVKTYREQSGKEPEIGYEWTAGIIRDGNLGCFKVRLTSESWKVFYERFSFPEDDSRREKKLANLQWSEEAGDKEKMEKKAKALAVNIYREALAMVTKQGGE